MTAPDTRRSTRRPRKRGRRIRASLAGLAVVILGLTVPASAAFASTGGGNQIAPDSSTGYVSSQSMIAQFVASPYQLIARWSNATDQFHQMASGAVFGVSVAGIVQWFESIGMAFNNVMWQLSQWLVTMSGSFQLLTTSFGHSMDTTVGTIGGVIMNGIPGSALQGPVIFVIILLVAVGIAVAASMRARNGAMLLRRLIGITLISAVFAVMVSQASVGTESDGVYHPAPLSPGWVGSFSSGIVDKVSGGLSDVVAGASFAGSDLTSQRTDSSNLSCGSEVKGLGLQLGATPAAIVGDKAQESALNAVNALYANTALAAYEAAQFGSNPYGLRVWCRGADFNSDKVGVTSIQQSVYSGAAGVASIDSGAPASAGGPGWLGTPVTDGDAHSAAGAFGNGTSAVSVWDQQVIAWAACHPAVSGSTSSESASDVTFTIDAGWANIDGASVTQADCQKWWANPSAGIPPVFSTISGWSADDADQHIHDQDVSGFVNTLHGNDQAALWSGLVGISAASFGSLTNSVIIGGLALGNIIAKVMLMFLLFILPFVLLRGLFSRGPMFEHVGRHLKAILGVLIFTVALGFILALITLLSSLLSSVGSAIVGSGNIMSMVWTAACPVLAVIGLHFMFKRLGLPSPVTVTGAAAWGSMLTPSGAAAAGGAVGAGIGARVQGAASRLGKGATDAAGSAVTGGSGTRGGAAARAATAGAAGGAAGAAAADSVSRRGARARARDEARQAEATAAARAQFEAERGGAPVASPAARRGAVASAAAALGTKAANTKIGQSVSGAYGHTRTAAKWISEETKAGRATTATAKAAATVTTKAATTRAGQVAGRAALVGGAAILGGPIGLAAATAGVHAARRMKGDRETRQALVESELAKLRAGAGKEAKEEATSRVAPEAASPATREGSGSLILPGTPAWKAGKQRV